MTGIDAIAAERKLQIEVEDWTPEHDDEHTDGSLSVVAAIYATHPIKLFVHWNDGGSIHFEDPWPEGWDSEWDRRDDFDERRRLVIAGALIVAEIDRLDRLSEKPE